MSERAFLAEMTAHHQSAIHTGRLARERGQSRFVRDLGADIVRTQARRGAPDARRSTRRLVGGPMPVGADARRRPRPGSRAHARFDRAFVDHMIPHHQDAVRMARAVRTDDRELRALAAAIVTAQRREIAAMRRFRDRNYGTPEAASPAGDGHGGHGD